MLKLFFTNINKYLGKDYKYTSFKFDNKGTTEVNNETSSKLRTKVKYHKKVSFRIIVNKNISHKLEQI